MNRELIQSSRLKRPLALHGIAFCLYFLKRLAGIFLRLTGIRLVYRFVGHGKKAGKVPCFFCPLRQPGKPKKTPLNRTYLISFETGSSLKAGRSKLAGPLITLPSYVKRLP